jgi:hypothetical protein
MDASAECGELVVYFFRAIHRLESGGGVIFLEQIEECVVNLAFFLSPESDNMP